MRKRCGRYGEFWGCSKYPGCRGTRQIGEEPDEDDRTESFAERDARRPEEELDL
jgi:ssDNA-binding Zn-finger/Zn-ribbon topoisomerase 1